VSVGESLARAREDRGLSVADVAEQTRIRSTLIRAIEADDFAPCGGAVYARGHIRSIARVVGIDSVPLVAEFDAANHVEPMPSEIAAQPTDARVIARSDRHGPNWAAAMAVALVVICALAVVGLLNRGGGGKGTASPQASPSARVHATTPATSPAKAKPPRSAVAQLPANEASMLIRTTHGKTWLQVETEAGATLFSGLLEPGHSKLFTDKHGLLFTIGNAPAVDVVVNGHDIGSPHTASLVLRGRVVPGSDTVQQT